MHRHPTFAIFAAACLSFCFRATTVNAALYAQDFDVDDTANWTVNDPGLSDIEADFFYDYSAIGVPAAPGGASTRGLKMTANNSGGVFSGFSVSPTGQSFSGDYRLSFHIWQNYVGPLGPGGSGTTQLSTYGIGSSGAVAVWPAGSTSESLTFGTTLDGGSSSDYRIYNSANPTSAPSGDPSYSAPGGSRNGSDPYYGVFGGASAPAAQVALFPGQTGSTSGGETAFDWALVELTSIGGIVTWEIDGTSIATVDTAALTLGGGNILFGHSDTNTGSSSDANDSLLNVTLIDNVHVDLIPEPSAALLALGAASVLLHRSRKRAS